MRNAKQDDFTGDISVKKMILGQSDLDVTQLCLGTMTWGSSQNDQADGHAQIDYAAERGINFMDTAELYPVNPVAKETLGNTETIIGNWVAKNPSKRADWVIATKMMGPSGLARDGAGVTSGGIFDAVDASLARLQTDVIDLYQFHWPNRGSFHFRQNWNFDATGQNTQETLDHMADVLQAMEKLQKSGKVRHFGLSNDSAWGTAQWLRLANELGAPRMQTIQNEYSLLNRHYDLDLAELAHHEKVTLLAYSPLGCGLLSGKYQGGTQTPDNSRRALNGDLGGRVTPTVWPAVDAYVEIANKHGLDPAQMALAFIMQRPMSVSPIFGATTMAQLKTAIDADAVTLSKEVLAEIQTVYRAHPMPM